MLRVKPGDTFKSDPITGISHLHIVVMDVPVAQEVLLASVTTYEDEKDSTCILEPGDHPFVRHTSCISYRHVRIVSRATLQTLIDKGRLATQPSLAQPVLDRVIAGMRRSPEIRSEVREWIRRYAKE